MKEDKKLFVLYILLVPCAAISSSLFSMNLEPLINVVYSKNADDFVKYAFMACGFAVADMVTHYYHKICREKLRIYYVAGLKRDLFNGVITREISEFNGIPIAQYLSVITKDVEKMSRCYFDSFCGIYRVTVCFFINLGLVIYINPVVALINIMISSISVFIPRLFQKKMIEKQEISSEKSEYYYGLLKDYLSGFSTIKLFHIQKVIEERIEKSNRELEDANYKSVAINYTSAWFSMLCSELSFVITIIVGIWMALEGYMSVGGIVAISQLIGGIAVPFEELPEHLSNYKSIESIRNKIYNMQKKRDGVLQQKFTLPVGQNSFVVDNISFGYEKEKLIIENVSFQLKENGKYIMVGGSGCGKSTLAKLLMRVYNCTNGKVLFGDRELSEYSEEQLYRLITYLEQDVFLFDDTLFHNITLYQNYTTEEVERVIQLTGLSKLVEGLPEGIYTKITGNGQNFSGGEKQRIGIARALISGAKFLILDEMTANLDPVLAAEIENTIMNLPDTGVLYITHKWSDTLLKDCDEILVMKNGRLMEKGTFEELMNQKQYFYSYYYSI